MVFERGVAADAARVWKLLSPANASYACSHRRQVPLIRRDSYWKPFPPILHYLTGPRLGSGTVQGRSPQRTFEARSGRAKNVPGSCLVR